MQATRTILAVATLVALVAGCGGGTSGGGGSGGMDDITWPDRGGGTTTQPPPAIETGRVFFSSESGEACCVALDPALLAGDTGRGLAVLTDLPPGRAVVIVSGFTTSFAPAVPGVVTTCSTIPPSIARACDPVLVAAPAFESPPLAVTIVAGAQTDIGQVPLEAFPFLFSFSPAQGSDAAAPVQFALTVVDAVTNIDPESVALEVSFEVPDQQGGSGSPFRRLTKRVNLTLNECDDDDDTKQPCSPEGSLELAGFAANGTAPELPEGEVEARITAENLGDPPHSLDFRYPFFVLATPTATATAVPTESSAGTANPSAAETDDGAASAAASAAAAGSSANGEAPERAAAEIPAAQHDIPPTPTATPLPGGTS